jgi:hypothetical protein
MYVYIYTHIYIYINIHRVLIMEYFKEEKPFEKCGNCDICLNSYIPIYFLYVYIHIYKYT